MDASAANSASPSHPCFSVVGQDVGLIEIVPDCQTIASILSDYSQKKGGTSFTKAISASFGSDDAIYSWLLEKHLAREGPSGATAESSKSSPAKRGVVADVLPELDAIAGRMAVVRAGRGEEYDPMTGELVACAKKH